MIAGAGPKTLYVSAGGSRAAYISSSKGAAGGTFGNRWGFSDLGDPEAALFGRGAGLKGAVYGRIPVSGTNPLPPWLIVVCSDHRPAVQ